ncbi:MAG: AMP-binding protein [Gordonia sp. (in: high G+C Gram-positive bacteria)]
MLNSNTARDAAPGIYDRRPWLAQYPRGHGPHLRVGVGSALEMFEETVRTRPDAPALEYLGQTMSWAQLDDAAGALAGLLIARGFAAGDRLAMVLQNDPAVLISLVATWRVGGVAVLISPMSTAAEMRDRLSEFTPRAVVALDDLYHGVLRPVLADGVLGIAVVVTASPRRGPSGAVWEPRLFDGPAPEPPTDTIDLWALIAPRQAPSTPPSLPPRPVGPFDTAVLMATSGTTGTPKGACLTHANLVFSAHVYRDWTGFGRGATPAPILGASPLFHVTGLLGGALLSMLTGAQLVLTHRFTASVVLDAIRRTRPQFVVAVITAFVALADESDSAAADFESLTLRFSGGAPVDPATAERIAERLGGYIHNVYGLTESTSPTHMVPVGVNAPVDPETGVLSVGVPVFDTVARVVDEDGIELPAGEIGELVVSGPQVINGYWNNPEATSHAFSGTELRTGDIGFMDADGWFYVLDRRSDMINAAGYKVWPNEVERVLLSHPAVLDAAVVSIPDDYRGESVKAFVVVEKSESVTERALIEFCRDRLAAYKYPREVELVGSLPRTVTGKLLRRELR